MNPPIIKYWRVWVDKRGDSCQTLHALKGHQQSVFAKGTPAIWNAQHITGDTRLVTAILMPGVVGEWHENPSPQWIIPLRGRWGVETMDGKVVEMGPGDISFGGDQGTRNNQGHRSWAIGNSPSELLLVQVSEAPDWNPLS